ncbi:DUF7619 domain-containing protein [Winogradskyella sp.]|uniref:DUF7619 domain-containing protein n=1 Tax=Winogradskyella sp. TaxID=1883156 RepID=UPI003F6AFAA0
MKKLLLFSTFVFFNLSVYCQLPRIDLNDLIITEGESQYFVIGLNFPSDSDIIINIDVVGGTADGNDYNLSTNTVTILSGQVYAEPIDVNTFDDNLIEQNIETIEIQATVIEGDVDNPVISNTIKIIDNDILPQVSMRQYFDGYFREGGQNDTQFIMLNRVFSEAIEINIIATPITANTADFEPLNVSIIIPAGERFVNVPFTINDDDIPESDESFLLTANVISGNTENVSTNSEILIRDNDILPTFSVIKSASEETGEAKVKLKLDRTYNSNITFELSTSQGTADSMDYIDLFTNGTISANEFESDYIDISIIDDNIEEGDEYFNLSIIITSNNTLNSNLDTTLYIWDNEIEYPKYFIDSAHGTSAYEGSNAYISINLYNFDGSYTYEEDITFEVWATNGTADESDYSTSEPVEITILAGQNYIRYNDIPLTLDQEIEGDETIFLHASPTSGNTYNQNFDPLEFTIKDIDFNAIFDSIEIVQGTEATFNLLENDYYQSQLITDPSVVTIELLSYGLSANMLPGVSVNANGLLSVSNDLAIGNYSLKYRICKTSDPDNCSVGIISLSVKNPLKTSYTINYLDYNNDGYTSVGDLIQYDFKINNIGDDILTDVESYEYNSPIEVQGTTIPSLNPSEENTEFFAERVITQSDINSGIGPYSFYTNGLVFTGHQSNLEFVDYPSRENTLDIINSDGLKLNAFVDENSNGIKDFNEIDFPLGKFKYDISNNNDVHYLYSNPHYLYESNPTTVYNFSFEIDDLYLPYFSNNTIYNDISIEQNAGFTTILFPIESIENYTDASVYIIPNIPKPGFAYYDRIKFKNNSLTSLVSGSISYTHDDILEIINISSANTTLTENGFTYNFYDLEPLETREILVKLQVPAIPEVQLGEFSSNTVEIVTTTEDIVSQNNIHTVTNEIVGSYDPNDITENHGTEIIYSTFSDEDYLTYTIRFENTGTANAINIRIEDILDDQLDETTLRMVDASHDYALERVGKNLEWNFYAIQLPPSEGDDSEIGHGYIKFKVKPQPGYQVGDVIPNTAEIYFDFNPAIITNTWTTTFVENLSLNSNSDSEFLNLYPNPTKDRLNISCENIIDSITITTIIGQQVSSLSINNNYTELNIKELPSGVYLIKIISEKNSETIKIIKE